MMNTKDSEEYQEKMLQLQNAVDNAKEKLAALEEGYDLHSPAVIQARKILEIRLNLFNEAKNSQVPQGPLDWLNVQLP